MQEFRRGRHSVSLLTVHLVCVTKYRRRIFDGAALNWLAGHFREVCETMDCRLIASDGETDHVHMLVEYPPKVSVSALVNILKGTSSRMLRRHGQILLAAITRAPSGRTRTSPLRRAAQSLKPSSAMSRRKGARLPPRPEGRGFRRGNYDENVLC